MVKIDISGLEFDAKSLDRVVSESKTKTKTNTCNIGTINSNIADINNSLSGLDGIVTVFVGKPDYTII